MLFYTDIIKVQLGLSFFNTLNMSSKLKIFNPRIINICLWIVFSLTIIVFSLFPRFQYAQQTPIDSLQNVWSSSREDTNKVNTLNLLAMQLLATGDYEKILNCTDQAIDLSE